MGRIEAVYSGRFAFVNSLNGMSFEQLFLTEKQQRSDIAEEFLHYKLMRYSLLGLGLLSLRWFVRLIFNSFGKSRSIYPVYFYYVLRTLYFANVYDYFEKDTTFKITLFRLLVLWKLEFKIIKLAFNHLPLLYILLFLFILPLHIIFGFIINYHFAFISINEGNYINISYRKYLNNKKSVLNQISQKTWIENWFNAGLSKIDWAIIKFTAERDILVSLKKNEIFKNYVFKIVKFAVSWTGIDCDPLQFEATCRLLRDANLKLKDKKFDNSIIINSLFWDFFYRHGN